MRYPHMTNRVRVGRNSAIIDRANELKALPIWDRYSIATQEVDATLDSTARGDVALVIRCCCPECGGWLEVELTGGQIVVK